MTTDRLEQYRRLVEQHQANGDPLIMIRVDDLAALLTSYEWLQADARPRVRRKARLMEVEQ